MDKKRLQKVKLEYNYLTPIQYLNLMYNNQRK